MLDFCVVLQRALNRKGMKTMNYRVNKANTINTDENNLFVITLISK